MQFGFRIQCRKPMRRIYFKSKCDNRKCPGATEFEEGISALQINPNENVWKQFSQRKKNTFTFICGRVATVEFEMFFGWFRTFFQKAPKPEIASHGHHRHHHRCHCYWFASFVTFKEQKKWSSDRLHTAAALVLRKYIKIESRLVEPVCEELANWEPSSAFLPFFSIGVFLCLFFLSSLSKEIIIHNNNATQTYINCSSILFGHWVRAYFFIWQYSSLSISFYYYFASIR